VATAKPAPRRRALPPRRPAARKHSGHRRWTHGRHIFLVGKSRAGGPRWARLVTVLRAH
jgi:hypothetical protein